jgi:threonine dehydratase
MNKLYLKPSSLCWSLLQLPSLAQIRDARTVVYRSMPPTPKYTWPLLSERLGTEAWIKHESHTPVGAFKLRGAFKEKNSLQGKRIDIILTGGNVDREIYEVVLAGRL